LRHLDLQLVGRLSPASSAMSCSTAPLPMTDASVSPAFTVLLPARISAR
jgi:hypothetical protein